MVWACVRAGPRLLDHISIGKVRGRRTNGNSVNYSSAEVYRNDIQIIPISTKFLSIFIRIEKSAPSETGTSERRRKSERDSKVMSH